LYSLKWIKAAWKAKKTILQDLIIRLQAAAKNSASEEQEEPLEWEEDEQRE